MFLLSICVPTFNRASSLLHLMNDISIIKLNNIDIVEVCISNNCSDDGTHELINQFSQVFDFKYQVLSQNIGASSNFKSVCNMSTAKWILSVGDDDRLEVLNFNSLLTTLASLGSNYWVLANVQSLNCRLLGAIRPGRYNSVQANLLLLFKNLHIFGFLGTHIIPRVALVELSRFSPDDLVGWPHLSLLLSHILSLPLFVFKPVIVYQAPSGSFLFWRYSEWLQISLRKFYCLKQLHPSIFNSIYVIHKLQLIRLIFSISFLKEILMWKILDGTNFRKELPAFCTSIYNNSSIPFICSFFYRGYVNIVNLIPCSVFGLLGHINPQINEKIKNYQSLKFEMSAWDSNTRKY